MTQYIDKSALVAEIEKRRNKHFNSGGSPSSEYCYEDDEILNIIDTLEVKEVQEEPVSEEFEEASKEWLIPQLDKSYTNYGEAKMMELTHFDGYAMLDAIEFGANWQKAKDESTTEDLSEYINELSKQFPEVSFAKLSRIAVRVAKWQKEQMMTKAIDAKLLEGHLIRQKGVTHPLYVGDKVKVIVIKEE